MTGFLLDVRVALRSLRRARTMSLAVVTCLALGIGANVAVFSVVRAVLLRGLPFPDADQLIGLWVGYDDTLAQSRFFVSPQQFMEIRDRNDVLTEMAAYRAETMSLHEDDFPAEVTGARASSSLFDLLGASPLVGRAFQADEEVAGSGVAMVSEGLWHRTFGGQSDIVGRALRLDGEQYRVVGVLPASFRVPPEVDVWIPLNAEGTDGRDRVAGSLTVLGRLRPDISLEAARQRLTIVADAIARDLPDRNTNLRIGIMGWQDFLVETVRSALTVLMVAVAGVLAVAVLNVAGLLLVRAQAERRHQALREALGATRLRLLRYLAVENGLLAGFGCVAGVAAAYLLLPALLALQPTSLSPFRDVALDRTTLAFALSATLVIVVAITSLTAWDLRQLKIANRVAEGSAGSGLSKRSLLAQRVLVISQIAASVVLMVGSSLLVRSFLAIQRTDPGFETANVLVVRVGLPPAQSTTHEARVAYMNEVLNRVRGLPGVREVGAAHVLPVTDTRWGLGFNVEGQPPETPAYRHSAVWRLVTPGYYEAMGVQILRGRSFEERDRMSATPVVVVSQQLADRFWPGEDPIGKRVKRGTYEDPDEPWRTVVGVMRDVSDSALAGRARASLHFPYEQYETSVATRMNFVVKLDREPQSYANAMLEAIRQIDRSTLIPEIAPYADLLGETVAQERFNTLLMGAFSGMALLLAAVGIYGIVSYSVAQRRAEFGLRMVLGAQGSRVCRLMLRAGTTMAVIGVTAGLTVAYLLSPAVGSLLRTGDPRAPGPYVVAALLLTATTVLAAWIPARRATRVSLVETLRR